MNNELVLGLMAIFGSIFAGLQLWQIKRISDLCERVTRMETEIEHHFNGKHDESKTRRFA
jgi:cytochrome oxidase assembly protein ShyY1